MSCERLHFHAASSTTRFARSTTRGPGSGSFGGSTAAARSEDALLGDESAQTERVTGRIDQHPPSVRARLLRRLMGARIDRRALCGVEVIYREVEMYLLRCHWIGPGRGLVIL